MLEMDMAEHVLNLWDCCLLIGISVADDFEGLAHPDQGPAGCSSLLSGYLWAAFASPDL
jgi:hypothetical protein